MLAGVDRHKSHHVAALCGDGARVCVCAVSLLPVQLTTMLLLISFSCWPPCTENTLHSSKPDQQQTAEIIGKHNGRSEELRGELEITNGVEQAHVAEKLLARAAGRDHVLDELARVGTSDVDDWGLVTFPWIEEN